MSTTPAAVEALPSRASQHPRISSLDGIRALAVSTVVAAHIEYGRAARSANWKGAQFLAADKIGQFALIFFFVISGFLITLLLLGELDRNGRIALLRFYFRRAMRIIPPMYLFALGMAFAVAVGWRTIDRSQFIAAAIFTSNYCHACRRLPGHWFFGHVWTLAVDGQFYVLWPAVLASGGRRRGIQIAVAALVLAPVLRFVQTTDVSPWHGSYRGLEGVADAIAMGCLLAMLRDRLHATWWYPLLLKSRLFALVPVTAILVQLLSAYPSVMSPQTFAVLVIPFLNLLVALCLDWAVTNSSRPVGRLLNTRPLALVGAMSYSIYLWHLIGLGLDDGGKLRILVGVAFGATCGVASYYFVERPALRLRTWLEPRIFRLRAPDKARAINSEAAALTRARN